MYEFAVARKYLIPRVRQLSVSIISLISVFVIATVVWLSIVFFSVQEGIEQSWTEKMVALTAPVRLTPTAAYYQSYYYQIDAYSEKSNFANKSLKEKLESPVTDPYDPSTDSALPLGFAPKSDIDIVKETKSSLQKLPNVTSSIFETASCSLKLKLLRDFGPQNSPQEQVIVTNAFLMNSGQKKTDLPVSAKDITNLVEQTLFHQLSLAPLFRAVTISQVITPTEGWKMPPSFLQEGQTFSAIGHYSGNKLLYITFSEAEETSALQRERGSLAKKNGLLLFNAQEIHNTPLYLEGNISFTAKQQDAPKLELQGILQGKRIQGTSSIEGLQVAAFSIANPDSFAKLFNNPIVLPKGFKDAGALIGDEGHISYQGFGTTGMQDLRSSVQVAGFYDPGIIPIGGKIILAPPELVSQVQSSTFQDDRSLPTGFAVDFPDLKMAHMVKAEIVKSLEAKGLNKYWNVQTYDEYEFTKDIFQQMKSDKNLFSLISVIITIVACSNIISMLIILVHDKRKEIAIMRALGATKKSIASIFGLCGFFLGMSGSLLGTLFAIVTLHNLNAILGIIGKLQGFEVLSSTFYANTLPSEVSGSALLFVIIVSAIASMIAGIVPAIQASRINTSEALRNE